jgi:anti-anti-sigma regulatory factor
MRVDLERTADEAVVTARGRLTASEAGRIHQALLEAFAGSRRVELALGEVQEADLSFLQLLCAAHRSAASRGVAFTVSGLELAQPVQRLIREAGAERGVGCPGGCLWPSASSESAAARAAG